MELDLFQIDAFASRPFEGNPAAVCPLPDDVSWPDDRTLQAVAMENNLAETAFFQREGDAYRLRWFTPALEVNLCGHATLASAWALFNRLGYDRPEIAFETRSGRLVVRREGERLVMNFPATPPIPIPCIPADLVAALGVKVEAAFRADGGNGATMAVLAKPADVAALKPNFSAIAALDGHSVIVTAPGGDTGYDFISRMFAPAAGINEDPVTGSAHCLLTPYWAGRLGKRSLKARQVSPRGGDVDCRLLEDRVELSGVAALYMTGRIALPE